MTDQEAAKLIYTIRAAYPQHFAKMTEADFKRQIAVWKATLEGYSYEEASAGCITYLRGDTKGFPPSPGQIIGQMEEMRETVEPEMTAAEAWSLVRRALSDSLYHARERFEELPEDVQRAVGSPSALRDMGMSSDNSYAQGRFERTYTTLKERAKREKKYAPSVRKYLEGVSDKLRLEEQDG